MKETKYFVVGTFDEREKIFIHAERVAVIDRCIMFYNKNNLIFSMNDGYWTYVAAASADGHEIAVENWIKNKEVGL